MGTFKVLNNFLVKKSTDVLKKVDPNSGFKKLRLPRKGTANETSTKLVQIKSSKLKSIV